MSGWRHGEGRVNGLRLHWVEAGDGPLLLLLHGFPDFWYSRKLQIPALAQSGFHVVAPDLRGYNLSEKPKGARSYRIEALVNDGLGLIEHFGAGQARLAGHDWGGAVAWALAAAHPERVARLAVLNSPHPAAMARELRRLRQLRRSWYIFFFQLPWLPEAAIRWRGFARLRRLLRRDPVRPHAFTDEDIRLYVEALAQPGALTASLNYYRAAVRGMFRRRPKGSSHVGVPALLIWGEQDRYLGLELTENMERWIPDLRVQRLPDASHWVHWDAPDEVNRYLLDFFTAPEHR
ncbi:MAG: alpha/beta hydrolase [Planctomycetota bacterium]|nr:MAG: alpha/beta hydrolase [Planctomycetota bacterium]